MKNIPKHIIVVLVLIVVIGLVGGGGWYWTSTMLSDKIQEKQDLEGKLRGLEGKEIFPSRKNKEALTEREAKMEELLAAVKPEIDSKIGQFADVRTIAEDGTMTGLQPDQWKKLFVEKRDELRKLAASKKVALPDDYSFSFKAYVFNSPRAEHTLNLGVQLEGIDTLGHILFESDIKSLSYVKRALIEAPVASGPAAGGEETLNASILDGPHGMYRVLPFELSFTCLPADLTKVLNGIQASDLTFVARFIYIENEKLSMPKRSEVIAAASAGAVPANGVMGGVTEPAVKKKVLNNVSGQELIKVRMRVDLVDFLPPTAVAKAENPKTKAPAKEKKGAKKSS